MTAPAIFVLVFLVLAIYTGFASIKIVKQGYEYTVLRLGRFNRVLSPGFHILVPFYESVGHKVNMKEQVLDVKCILKLTVFILESVQRVLTFLGVN